MYDIWLIDGLLVAALLYWPFSLIGRNRPRVLAGPGIKLPELTAHSEPYNRRRRLRLVQLASSILVCAYLIVRAAVFPPVPTEWIDTVRLGLGVEAALAVSLLIATYLRFRLDGEFVSSHPEFSDCLQPLGSRIVGLALGLGGISLMLCAFLVQDEVEILAIVVAGVVLIRVARKLQTISLVRNQVPLPLDSPLGERISATIRAFGYSPKACILIPSLSANGYAMPDGTVALTTALRVIATDDEVAAVVAHELSHTRDGDGKRIQRRRILGIMSTGAVSCCAAGLMPSASLAFPIAVSMMASLSPLSSWWLARLTQPMEFKCDRDATHQGLGAELASVLATMARYTGIPTKWTGLDRLLLTHPDLEDRVDAIQGEIRASAE
jgi:Zn-dependent protease with chaperone function